MKHDAEPSAGPIAPGSPWQNGFAERLIGSIRREYVYHIVVLGEAHLRRTLTKYAAYYSELRTHRSLGKDAPIHRAIRHVDRIAAVPVLGGLHRHLLQNLIFGTDNPTNHALLRNRPGHRTRQVRHAARSKELVRRACSKAHTKGQVRVATGSSMSAWRSSATRER